MVDRRFKVINLFCGQKTWLVPWIEHGHDVWTTDIDMTCNPDLAIDIFDLDRADIPWGPGEVDVVLASPDCRAFSVLRIGRNWDGPIPKTDDARYSIEMIKKTVEIIEYLNPRFVVIENPVGMLRKLDLIPWERRTVTYCHYGEDRMKPTDLWGIFPDNWVPRPLCHKREDSHPQTCCCSDHEAAPRGATTGTQKFRWRRKAHIPRELTYEIYNAIMAN